MSNELGIIKSLTTLQHKIDLTTPYLDYIFGRSKNFACVNNHLG